MKNLPKRLSFFAKTSLPKRPVPSLSPVMAVFSQSYRDWVVILLSEVEQEQRPSRRERR